MKNPILILATLTAAPHLLADPLSQTDRQALLEKLEEIRQTAQSKVDSRFSTATSAFRSAMGSPDAARALYLKCVEKIEYQQENKKSSDFRKWKRDSNEKIKDEAFARYLQQQLRWLTLSLKAASEEPDRDALALEASEIIQSITSQAENLAPYRKDLEKPVTQSVFARAYGIDSLQIEDWSLSPLPLANTYSKIILPPLRKPDRLTSLKSAWQNRIAQERTAAEHWKPDDKDPTASLIHFRSKTLPTLQWAAEKDFYQAGDQKGAALRLLNLIESNLTHPAAPEWVDEFNSLLKSNPTK